MSHRVSVVGSGVSSSSLFASAGRRSLARLERDLAFDARSEPPDFAFASATGGAGGRPHRFHSDLRGTGASPRVGPQHTDVIAALRMKPLSTSGAGGPTSGSYSEVENPYAFGEALEASATMGARRRRALNSDTRSPRRLAHKQTPSAQTTRTRRASPAKTTAPRAQYVLNHPREPRSVADGSSHQQHAPTSQASTSPRRLQPQQQQPHQQHRREPSQQHRSPSRSLDQLYSHLPSASSSSSPFVGRQQIAPPPASSKVNLTESFDAIAGSTVGATSISASSSSSPKKSRYVSSPEKRSPRRPSQQPPPPQESHEQQATPFVPPEPIVIDPTLAALVTPSEMAECAAFLNAPFCQVLRAPPTRGPAAAAASSPVGLRLSADQLRLLLCSCESAFHSLALLHSFSRSAYAFWQHPDSMGLLPVDYQVRLLASALRQSSQLRARMLSFFLSPSCRLFHHAEHGLLLTAESVQHLVERCLARLNEGAAAFRQAIGFEVEPRIWQELLRMNERTDEYRLQHFNQLIEALVGVIDPRKKVATVEPPAPTDKRISPPRRPNPTPTSTSSNPPAASSGAMSTAPGAPSMGVARVPPLHLPVKPSGRTDHAAPPLPPPPPPQPTAASLLSPRENARMSERYIRQGQPPEQRPMQPESIAPLDYQRAPAPSHDATQQHIAPHSHGVSLPLTVVSRPQYQQPPPPLMPSPSSPPRASGPRPVEAHYPPTASPILAMHFRAQEPPANPRVEHRASVEQQPSPHQSRSMAPSIPAALLRLQARTPRQYAALIQGHGGRLQPSRQVSQGEQERLSAAAMWLHGSMEPSQAQTQPSPSTQQHRPQRPLAQQPTHYHPHQTRTPATTSDLALALGEYAPTSPSAVLPSRRPRTPSQPVQPPSAAASSTFSPRRQAPLKAPEPKAAVPRQPRRPQATVQAVEAKASTDPAAEEARAVELPPDSPTKSKVAFGRAAVDRADVLAAAPASATGSAPASPRKSSQAVSPRQQSTDPSVAPSVPIVGAPLAPSRLACLEAALRSLTAQVDADHADTDVTSPLAQQDEHARQQDVLRLMRLEVERERAKCAPTNAAAPTAHVSNWISSPAPQEPADAPRSAETRLAVEGVPVSLGLEAAQQPPPRSPVTPPMPPLHSTAPSNFAALSIHADSTPVPTATSAESVPPARPLPNPNPNPAPSDVANVKPPSTEAAAEPPPVLPAAAPALVASPADPPVALSPRSAGASVLDRKLVRLHLATHAHFLFYPQYVARRALDLPMTDASPPDADIDQLIGACGSAQATLGVIDDLKQRRIPLSDFDALLASAHRANQHAWKATL